MNIKEKIARVGVLKIAVNLSIITIFILIGSVGIIALGDGDLDNHTIDGNLEIQQTIREKLLDSDYRDSLRTSDSLKILVAEDTLYRSYYSSDKKILIE